MTEMLQAYETVPGGKPQVSSIKLRGSSRRLEMRLKGSLPILLFGGRAPGPGRFAAPGLFYARPHCRWASDALPLPGFVGRPASRQSAQPETVPAGCFLAPSG